MRPLRRLFLSTVTSTRSTTGAIPSGYVIHHINGIKNDNRIENLQMMTPSEHTRLHAASRRSLREQNAVSQISPISAGAVKRLETAPSTPLGGS